MVTPLLVLTSLSEVLVSVGSCANSCHCGMMRSSTSTTLEYKTSGCCQLDSREQRTFFTAS